MNGNPTKEKHMIRLVRTCKRSGCGRTDYALEVCVKHYVSEKNLIEFSKSMHPASLAKLRKVQA